MDRPAEIPGGVIGGSYRLVRALDGARGRVHEAKHDRLTGRFAIKLFPNADPAAFQRGAQLASALRHPGIVQVIDYGAPPGPGHAFAVMEYIEGRPLATILADDGRMQPPRVARLVDGIASGLAAAHAQGVAHGHLAPDRVLVAPTGLRGEQSKILGFGLDQNVSATPEMTELTPYTAPEQTTADADPRSDQFALAAIAYHLLTGAAPFDPPDDGDNLERPEPRSIRDYAPDVNVVVDDVVRRALSSDPGARWPDVTTFAQRLREAGDSGTALEEKTRVALAPYGVGGRVSATPTPVEALLTPPPPLTTRPPALIASVDVDLGTPSPGARSRLEALRLPPPPQPVRPQSPPPPAPAPARSTPVAWPMPTAPLPEPPATDLLKTGGGAWKLLLGAAAVGVAVLAITQLHSSSRPSGVAVQAGSSPRPPAPPPAAAPSSAAPAPSHPTPAAPVGARPEVVSLPSAAPADPPAAAPRHHHHHAPQLSPEASAEEALLGESGAAPAPAARPAAKPAADESADNDDAPPERARAAAGACTITITSKPWTQVWLDGKDTRRHTPLVGYTVACGDHQLALKRDDLDIYQMEVITVRPDAPFKKSYPLE
jgi:serine/threonine-protein kinase